MSFFPPVQRRLVPGAGRKSSKIAIVGDYTTPFDDKDLTPFSGPNGTVLESCLHAAKLIKADVYLTSLFKSKTRIAGKGANTDFFDENKKKFTELGLEHAQMLRDELEEIDANVIVVAGNSVLQALTDFTSVAKYRGYVLQSTKLRRPRKLIPTYSPGSTIRGGYINRHVIVHDLKKAKAESLSPEIVRPDRKLIFDHQTVEEVLEWLDYFTTVKVVSFDIEVINYEVAAVSLSADPNLSVVIPIGNSVFKPSGWDELEELQIWRALQRVLGNPDSDKVAQNSIFDIHFLLTRSGIVVRGKIFDTMIGHSVMFPELPKGLDFLGSLYCGSQEYWKDAVSFNNIKGDS
jgi:uracil-DNA glycosylase family 4